MPTIFIYAGLYGALFRRNKEAAFSNYRLWESLGFVIAYAYSTLICARMKLYIVMIVLGLGTICYILVEIRQLRKVSTLKWINNLFSISKLNEFYRTVSKRSLKRNLNSHIAKCQLNQIDELRTRQMTRRMNWRRTLLSHICRKIERIHLFRSRYIVCLIYYYC